jgi:hypothetical protein
MASDYGHARGIAYETALVSCRLSGIAGDSTEVPCWYLEGRNRSLLITEILERTVYILRNVIYGWGILMSKEVQFVWTPFPHCVQFNS